MPPKADKKQQTPKAKDSKPVARAACLSCRIAKRRCDGIQPHCGPCQSRGFPLPPPDMPPEERAEKPNSTNYCVFVASRRGGPRYKGVVGAENELVKMEKEAEKARKQHQQTDAPEAGSNGISGKGKWNGNGNGNGNRNRDGNGSRGIKRERAESEDQLDWNQAGSSGTTPSSSSNSAAAIHGQEHGSSSESHRQRGNFQYYDHRSPSFSDTSQTNAPNKKSKHLNQAQTEAQAVDSRSGDQSRARTAAINAQQSFQQSRIQSQRTQMPGGAFSSVSSDFTFQTMPPGLRSNSISSGGGGSGISARPPVSGVLEAAEIARTETLSVATQRPEMFEPSKVRHGTHSFLNAQLSQHSLQSQNPNHFTQDQEQGYQSHHQHQHQHQHSQQHHHQNSQSLPSPVLSLSSHNTHPQPQFDVQSQFHSAGFNHQSGPHGDPRSNSTSHSNHNFHPFAMPSPLSTPRISSSGNPHSDPRSASFHSSMRTDSSIAHDQHGASFSLRGNHSYQQSSNRTNPAMNSSFSANPHVDGSQSRNVAQFNEDDDPAHALSSANLDLWQRLQRESENDGYAQDNFAQLYSSVDGTDPNAYSLSTHQAHVSHQHPFDQREPFSLDLNLPMEINTDFTGNILGNDFDLTMDMFNSFYNKLENLPKAGVNQNPEAPKEEKRPSRKERCRKAGDTSGSRSGTVDEENRARAVLSVFFENVYPTCPVLLPSSSLSSLAFYFTEKSMPCALWASISACAALHMGDDAHMTLRKGGGRISTVFKKKHNTMGDMAACPGEEESDLSNDEEKKDDDADNQERPKVSAVDIAAHHARTAEWLIERYTNLFAEEVVPSSKKKIGATKGEDVEMNNSSVPSLSPSSTSTFSHGTGAVDTPKAIPQSDASKSGIVGVTSQPAEAGICSLLPDLGLVAIEATAAKTLLAHYYYGGASGEGDSRRRAWELAKEAWKGAADLDLWDEGWEKEKEEARRAAEQSPSPLSQAHAPSGSSPSLAELIHSMKQQAQRTEAAGPDYAPSAGSPFTKSQRIEWARRTYWCAYEACVVMTATGGFNPKAMVFTSTSETEKSLEIRPGVGSFSREELEKATDLAGPPTDRGWATLIKGAQFVRRSYSSLYQLDELNQEMATGTKGHSSQQSLSARRSQIFDQMLALDEDIGKFLGPDGSDKGSDRNATSSSKSKSVATADAEFTPEDELHRALSVSGTMMATGATIILHRAQAYGRARLFMQPSCCVPFRSESNDTGIQYKASQYGIEARRPSAASRSSTDGSQSRREQHRPGRKAEQQPQQDEEEEEEVVPASAPISNYPPSHPGKTFSNNVSSLLSVPPNPLQMQASASIPSEANGNPQLQLPDTFFAGGPFLPSHSFNRCRSAAETMAQALKPILNELLAKIEVDDSLELEEASEQDLTSHQAPQINQTTSRSSPSYQDEGFAGGSTGSGRERESSSSRAQKALAMLNSADDSKRRAIVKKAPKLPPFSACSCVLGAYVLLMQSLAVRINSGAATPAALDGGSPSSSSPSLHQQVQQDSLSRPSLVPHSASLKALANSASARHPSQAGMAGPLINQFKSTANDFARILDFFSTVWPIASEYKAELSALLAANESLN